MKSFYLWLAFLSLFTLGLVDNGRGPIYPDLLNEFSLSDSRGALFFSLTSMFGLINNTLISLWLPRIGAFRTFQIYLALQVLAAIVIGKSTSFEIALIGTSILGVAMGGLGVVQNIIVGESTGASSKRSAYGLLHSMYGLSSFAAPILIATAYNVGLPWRTAFISLGIPTLALLFVSFFQNAPKQNVAVETTQRPLTKGERHAILSFGFVIMMYVAAELLVSTRLILYLRRDLGYDIPTANSYLAWFFALLTAGRLGAFLLPKSLSNVAVMQICLLLSFCSVLAGMLANPLWFAVSGLTMSAFFPAGMSFVQEEFKAVQSKAFPFIYVFHSLGIMSMHWLTGWLTDQIGLGRAFVIGPIALGAASLILLIRQKVLSRKSSFA